MEYIKQAKLTPDPANKEARAQAAELLSQIKADGESAVRQLAKRFDGWEGEFVLSAEKKADLISRVPLQTKADLQFAWEQVHNFAVAQRESLHEFETRPHDGVRLGQRVIPIQSAGCYVPGGRFAHAASAIMSVTTAKVAGVPFIVACSPPRGDSIAPEVAYAMDLAGADVILELGGVQAVASMALGLFIQQPVHMLVGPGNALVAETKALLAAEGVCGIDLVAGPTESAVIADRNADPMTVAIDLVSQAEHGPTSPVWLFTVDRNLAEQVHAIVPRLIADLPDSTAASAAWDDYGEILLGRDREEVRQISDQYAPEHVQVLADDLDWWLENLRNYGSLFLGEGSTGTHGDKCSGTNHILPTAKAAFFTGGLSVHKFLKICTYQEVGSEANRVYSAVGSRISRAEGMEAHARACDWRLSKFFPEQEWDFKVYRQKTVSDD